MFANSQQLVKMNLALKLFSKVAESKSRDERSKSGNTIKAIVKSAIPTTILCLKKM